MRRLTLLSFMVFLVQGCDAGPGLGGQTINLEKAREVSDSFMADIVRDRVDLAVSKMEPEFVASLGQTRAEAEIKKLLEYCGRPLEQEFKHSEEGVRLDLKNGNRPMLKFYYAATTSAHPKGVCFFTIEVVPSTENLRVAVFGPLMLKSGLLPEWLK